MHSGTDYPCFQKDIDSLLRLRIPSIRMRPIHPNKAVCDLLMCNAPGRQDLSRAESGVIRRLMKMVERTRNKLWLPDVVFKMFADIDLVLFAGYLVGKVRMSWRTQRQLEAEGTYGVLGITNNSKMEDPWGSVVMTGDTSIRLNADLILFADKYGEDDSFQKLWETLLHEMVVSGLF